MAKPKKGLPPSKARQQHQQGAKANPFELRTTKRKFDVVGKRDKSGAKNVVKARQEAVNKVRADTRRCRAARRACGRPPRLPALTPSPRAGPQRKQTLLVEYKQLRKSNTFIDRRFGGARPAALRSVEPLTRRSRRCRRLSPAAAPATALRRMQLQSPASCRPKPTSRAPAPAPRPRRG
jgi:hypothetical protein